MQHKNLGSLKRVDYEDTFSQTCDFEPHLREVLNRMFYGAPFWMRALLKLRNQCVQMFGLKVDEPLAFNAHELKSGDRLGFIEVVEISEQVAIFRGDDKHLDFRAVISIKENSLSCLTQVQFHNSLGKAYFLAIQPFHRLIVPALLKAALIKDQEVEKNLQR